MGTCRERLGRSGYGFRAKVTIGTACREQPPEKAVPGTILGFTFEEK